MKIWISTYIKMCQTNGGPQEDSIEEKEGMGAPHIVLDGHTRHQKCMFHYMSQEVNRMRDNIIRDLKEEMQKEIKKQEMELHASLKTELFVDIQRNQVQNSRMTWCNT